MTALPWPSSPTAHSTRSAGSRWRTPTSAPYARTPSRSTSATTGSSRVPRRSTRRRHPGARRRRLGLRRDVRPGSRYGRPPPSPSTSPGPAATLRGGQQGPARRHPAGVAAPTPRRTCATRSRCRCRRRSSTCSPRRLPPARPPDCPTSRRPPTPGASSTSFRSTRGLAHRADRAAGRRRADRLGDRRGRGADPVLPQQLPRPVRHRRLGGVVALDLAGHALATAREAVALLTAPDLPYREDATVVLESSQLALQVHESIGHPLELDRILGMERAFAGTSFVEPDDRGRLQYAAPLVTDHRRRDDARRRWARSASTTRAWPPAATT